MLRRGLTLVEVAVILVVVAVVLAVLFPALRQSQNLNKRARCASNLGNIVKSFVVYAGDNADAYPCVSGTSATAYDVTFKTNPTENNGSDALSKIDETQKGNPLAALWILVLTNQVAPKWLICPDDLFAGAPAPLSNAAGKMYDNFTGDKKVSYSVAYHWVASGKKVERGPWWVDKTDASQPIASDMAPLADPKADPERDPTMVAGQKMDAKRDADLIPKTYNSPNHGFDGQNVVYGDAHCDWQRNPQCGASVAGFAHADNIWTVTLKGKETAIPGGGIGSPIEDAKPGLWDTVMVPARGMDGKIK